jgi:hypothetical protein
MAGLESVYEIRDSTDVYVGSEDLSTYMWFGTIQQIRSTLGEYPDTSTVELGRRVVDSIVQNINGSQARSNFNVADSYTISAIETRNLAELVANLDELSLQLLARTPEMRDRIAAICDSVRNYSDFSVDLYDFLERYAAQENSPKLDALIRKVQLGLKASVLAEAHGPANAGSHGLSIYFPLPAKVAYDPLYSDPAFGLDFSIATRWPDVIRSYKEVFAPIK